MLPCPNDPREQLPPLAHARAVVRVRQRAVVPRELGHVHGGPVGVDLAALVEELVGDFVVVQYDDDLPEDGYGYDGACRRLGIDVSLRKARWLCGAVPSGEKASARV